VDAVEARNLLDVHEGSVRAGPSCCDGSVVRVPA
jgi:hypothetical protein